MAYNLFQGDCTEVLKTIPDNSIDCCVTDPPYAEISRAYGRLTEPDWHTLMDSVVTEVRRVLKPSGSAVFVLQPNSENIGTMRLWLWEFIVRWGKQWNFIQDAYWMNTAALPTAHCQRKYGLMRGSIKHCVWFGSPDCYRNQDAVLWEPSDSMKVLSLTARAGRKTKPSGHSMDEKRFCEVMTERGGVTPYNIFFTPNESTKSIHGARTPKKLAEWWVKYLCPVGGTVLDPFMGAGTIGQAALALNRNYVGIEQMQEYYDLASEGLKGAIVE